MNEPPDALATRLARWGATAHVEARLAGGNRNAVWAVRVHGVRYAARLSSRPVPAVEWEIALLDQLRECGMRVPTALRTLDGRAHADGLVLWTWMEGDAPASEADWRLVAAELDILHRLTRGWPQRPGFRSIRELIERATGGDVRLDLMPPATVRRVRDAWRPLVGEPFSVVHGDPGRSNVRIYGKRAALIDWDEARVDASVLDLAALPLDLAPVLGAERLSRARRAVTAWEVANAWLAEPEYARHRLAELDRDWG
jgi:Ser/Thr protein kinase RdoA (MazF antagonist)